MSEFDALILAAGLSSRMSAFKPLEPLAGKAALARVVELFRAVGARDVLVVVGNRAEETAAVARALDARPVRNERFAEGMFSSIQAGAAALRRDCPGFFLLPVDIPLVRPWTPWRLLEGFTPGTTLVAYPTFLSERGHPPLLAGALREAILNSKGEGGLRPILESLEAEKPEAVMEVPTPDEGVLLDMDTDEDFARLAERARRLGAPSPRECEALWDEQKLGGTTRAHCRAVARAAVRVGRALNEARPGVEPLDLSLIESAALVHDLAKGRRHHELEGGRLLMERGFSDIAGVVAAHRDIELADDAPITEREVVFLADKLVGGETLMPVERRYTRVLERHPHDPEAREAILGRLERARGIERRMEAELGRGLYELLTEDWPGGRILQEGEA